MAITATEVNKLRQQTGAGLMDCKKALEESGGDFDQAIDYLRKKGQKISAKRADREATEGAVIAKTTADNSAGVIVYLSCETDFVAKNEEFISFANKVAGLALDKKVSSKEDLLNLQLGGNTVQERIDEQVGKIGEKIEIAAFETLKADTVASYIHAGNKIGVLVALNKPGAEVEEVGRDIAMQIAAMNPVAVDESSVDENTKNKELEIAREQARAEGKPDQILDKIAEGRLQKFYKENTLIHQQYVKDSSKSVKEVLKGVDPDLKVIDFKRVATGA